MRFASTAYLHLSLLCLLLPIQWVGAFIISTMVHEACHLTALKLYRVPVFSISVHAFGMDIRTAPLLPGQEFICALAGPIGSAALLLLAKWMPFTALCGLFHLLYNLLPIHQADGGRILRCGLKKYFTDTTVDSCCRTTEMLVLSVIVIAGIYASVKWGLGLLPLVAAALVFCRAKRK